MRSIPEGDRDVGFADRMQEQPQKEALLALLVRAARDNPGQPDDPCLLYTSPSPRDRQKSRMPSSA